MDKIKIVDIKDIENCITPSEEMESFVEDYFFNRENREEILDDYLSKNE